MDTNKKIERMTVDGRRSEVHTFEQPVEGATHRITEHFEEIIPLEKKRRVVERIVPVVVERVTEQYDGNQVNKMVEKVASDDPTHCLHLVPHTHPVTADEVEAIVRKVVGCEGAVKKSWSLFGSKSMPNPHPTPAPVPVPAVAGFNFWNSTVVNYGLWSVLAVATAFGIWQFFIR